MEPDYNNVNFREQHIEQMPALYKSAFNLKVQLKSIYNKFFHPYQKVQASALTLYQGKEAVSFYGVIVQKFTWNNSVFYVAQSCDSMTHKEHGGKGLFVNLASMAYSNLRKQGINFVYGFPNSTIYELRKKKLSWIHDENIHVFKFPVSTLPIAKAVKKMPVFKGLYNYLISILIRKKLSNSKSFENSVVTADTGGVVHDKEYFDYKNTDDKFVLNIHGINVWIKVDGFLWVGDMEISAAEKLDVILTELKKIAVKIGCTSVVFHYQENTIIEKALRNIRSVDSKMPVGYLYLDENVKYSFKFCGADFDSW
ncbi:MAG: hypothetical protein K0S12_1877 [Bacteroidetes bacterium]|jgi:hypothetical protein|nr:hypothetical protein [Bacteroidota bacterium]